MKIKITLLFLILAVNLFAQNVHHNLSVKITPDSSYISVTDEIKISPTILQKEIKFKLNNTLKLKLNNDNLKLNIVQKSAKANDIGMDRNASENKLLLNEYSLSDFNPNDSLTFSITYEGMIHSPIKQSEKNYQRGFSESPGIISELGVYLAGSTYWVPTFENELVNFKMKVELPTKWKSVSQGKRIYYNARKQLWDSPTPQEEIFLIAAKFNEYKSSAGAVDIFAFFRTPDEPLANKYIETTSQYLEMYRKLVGPFPYTKFALVENFWETGYGMPSFTLLGEKIIRFPFILHSSYPHELLHNWWGNSVYVDFEKGNWCEGLTAYMADHLIKEQRGEAVEYRRATLQKFTDYVNEKNDFALSDFRSRYDGSSEAIGYGKSLMFFHMLRKKVGDENFKKSLQQFNRNFKFKRASFDDIRKTFEEVTETDLEKFFSQWIERKGAPELLLKDVSVKKDRNDFNLKFTIRQVQKKKPYTVDLPIYVVDKKGIHKNYFPIRDSINKFSLFVKDKPLKILLDPEFDIFRKLDPNEIPPAFTKGYGAEKTLMILPNKDSDNYSLYKNFTDSWIKGKEDKFIIKNNSELSHLPSGKTIWVLGNENKFRNKISDLLSNYNSSIEKDSTKFSYKSIANENNSFFATVNNPKNINKTILFLSINNKDAVPGLLRKLPHYGKYSYLAFSGDEPTNIEKGQWEVVNSPLIKNLVDDKNIPQPEFKNAEALAKLTSVFSSKNMIGTINYLASEEMKGRGLGTEELDQAAEFIANKFEEFGLTPGSDAGTYFLTFEKAFHMKGKMKVTNVIGILPGINSDLNDALVVSAHYDHLGLGWPDVRKGNENKIHYGADDNASGVAVMLELARNLSKSFKPQRTIIFVAFSGEEAGLVGSKHFVDNYKLFPANKIFANLNFDTVGRLFENKLMILNSNTARVWKFIFMGTEYTTGIKTDLITQDLDASDQVAFIEKGIPAIQFFSGPNEDYHKPTDIVQKIDEEGLIRVATVGKEVIEYLANRIEPMPFLGKNKNENSSTNVSNKETRKVSTGTMPDFSYSGKGVKVGAVSENSAGEKAGLQKGDIIKKFNDEEVKTLRDYSNMLKEHSAGDKIKLEIERNGETKIIELTLEER